ncbi:unnamed protein product [Ectocarpus sp. 12 AP-2014]
MLNENIEENIKFRKRLGEKIKSHRLKKDSSQHDLSIESDMARTQISRIENGIISTTVVSFVNIIKALELTDEQILDLLK